MALSIDVGLNIAGVRQGIEEIKALVNGINNGKKNQQSSQS